MNAEALKEAIRQELPHFLRTDPDLRAYILELTRREYAGREETRTQGALLRKTPPAHG